MVSRTAGLVRAIQDLSLARDVASVMAIVRRAARELTGADGATFVLRDGAFCHYVEEDAIGPLWKGQRFPLELCVSGWVMRNRQRVAIEDIYADARVPADAYRPTFVKSLVMVPIRTLDPIGAIGTYWATPHRATEEEIELLGALADSTSVAMENVDVYGTLERRIAERTAELVELQRQREEMAQLVAHDLKSPANGIVLLCMARLRNPQLSEPERRSWRGIQASADVINRLALNLVDLCRREGTSLEPRPAEVDLAAVLANVAERMAPLAEAREQRIELAAELHDARLVADVELLHRVLQNLLDNALRHNRSEVVRVAAREAEGAVQIRVIDEGPGIPAERRTEIFDKYTSLGGDDDAGRSVSHGLGLAFCRVAVEAHGGRIWAEANDPAGSAFVVELPRATAAASRSG